jgi:acetyl esterase
MQWFWAHYLGEQDLPANALACPLRALSHEGLPPAFVAVAEFDPLHDEGLAYAAALRQAGIRVVERDYLGLMHGFFWTLGLMPSGQALLRDIGEAMAAFGLTHGPKPISLVPRGLARSRPLCR